MTPTAPQASRATRPPLTRSSRRLVRRVGSGLLAALAVSSAATLAGSVLGGSAPAPEGTGGTVSVAAQTAAAPVPVSRATARRTVRASRSRTVAVGKRVPTRRVTRTVAVGPTFSGQASWYGGSFQGQRTADGEHFDTQDLTAASKTLPFGTRLRVCHAGCVVVRVNDRGPYVGGRVLDLSHAASRAIGFSGVAHVTATPVGDRTVTVVDRAALARLRAHEAHAARVVRSHQLRAAAAPRHPARPAATAAPERRAVPAPASAAVLAGSAVGLLGLRQRDRRRP